MTLTQDDIRRVRESLPRIREQALPTASHFYENLFTLAPELRPLFRDDLEGQGMRFLTALAMIAEALDDPASRDAEIAALARAHADVGVRPESFVPMGAALMVTLGETLGPEFDDSLRLAWRRAYDTIAAEMVRSASA